MVRTGTRTLEEVDGAETPATAAVEIAITVAEIILPQMNMHLKEK